MATILKQSGNIEAWPYGTSLRFVRFAPAFIALVACKHSGRYNNFDKVCREFQHRDFQPKGIKPKDHLPGRLVLKHY